MLQTVEMLSVAASFSLKLTGRLRLSPMITGRNHTVLRLLTADRPATTKVWIEYTTMGKHRSADVCPLDSKALANCAKQEIRPATVMVCETIFYVSWFGQLIQTGRSVQERQVQASARH